MQAIIPLEINKTKKN